MSAVASVECAVVEAGHCDHLEAIVVRGGRLRLLRLPALVGVLRHPSEGVVLFDTGYSPRVRAAAVGWPRCLYPWLVPFSTSAATSARAALARLGIAPEEVGTIVLSHFHPDHVGGLRDFPRARIVATADAWHRVAGTRGWEALRLGYLPELLPEDFRARLQLVEAFEGSAYGAFPDTFDLFGDASLRLVPLPGHAAGQIGLLAQLAEERKVLFVADACWLSAGYQHLTLPSRLTRLVVGDPRAQRLSLAQIQSVWRSDPRLRVVPSHCPSLAAGWEEKRACA